MGKDEFLASFECISELLKVEQVVGENATQTSVIREVVLPGRVRKITEVDTSLRNVQGRVIENKVVVEGVVHKQIFYVDDDTGQLKEFTVHDERFVHFVDVPGAMPGMNVQIHARVEFVGHDFIRETEVNNHKPHKKNEHHDMHEHDHHDGHDGEQVHSVFRQTVILEIFAKVTESIQLNVVVDVRGIERSRVMTELLKVESVIGEGASQVAVREKIDFGRPARKIKNIDAHVQNVNARVIENKVVVEGILHKQIYFVALENDVVFETSVDEPFTHFVDIPGAFPGANVQVYPRVEFVNVDIDSYDPSRGMQTAIIDIFVKVTETVQVDVVTDISGAKVTKELLKVSQVVGEGSRQQTIVANLQAPAEARKIAGPPDTHFENITTRVIENKVVIEGDLVKQVFFVRAGDFPEVLEFEVRERFTSFVDIPGAMPGHVVQVYPRVEFTDFEIDPEDRTRIRQNSVIEIFVKVTEFIQLEVVTDCDTGPIPSVTVYIVQPGDTLFHIAKRFGTTVDAIIRANPEIQDPNMIFPGQKILIPAPPKG
jgi:spore coat assembly protein SafA